MCIVRRRPFGSFAVACAATIVLVLSLAACPRGATKSDEPPATCAKAGDSCMFAPGKLGLCVEPLDGGAALVCQSQH